jgi:signal transduction histidine kinase
MQRGLPLDALDSRVVLLVYAVVFTAVGLLVALWGLEWAGNPLSGLSFEQHAVVRIAGAIASGAGLTGFALSRIPSPVERRRMLLWFAIAHAWVVLVIFLWSPAFGGGFAWSDVYWLVVTAAAGCLWLLAGWGRQAGDPEPLGVYVGLFGQRPMSGTERVRSEYERQIGQLAAQEERHRLARDLHDSVKQQVFAIRTAAATAEARLSTDPNGAREALAHVRGAARDATAELDALLDQLEVTPLENDTLVEAIRRQCEAVRVRTGTEVTCRVGPLPPSAAFPPGAHLALSRITQEALSNAARHARASSIMVALEQVGSRVQLTVSDDGSGYSSPGAPSGMGLRNIRARAEELGGEAHIGSKPGEGTTVLVTLPFRDGEPGYYLKRAGLWLAIFGFFLVTGRWSEGRGRLSLIIMVPVLVDTVRYFIAWRRASRLKAAAS